MDQPAYARQTLSSQNAAAAVPEQLKRSRQLIGTPEGDLDVSYSSAHA
jgi:hypothetical protein